MNSNFLWADDAATRFLTQFSEVVRVRRVQLRLSQGELGLRAGVTRSYISDIETGLRNNLSMKSLHRIACALEWSPAELLIKAETRYRAFGAVAEPSSIICEPANEQ
jgi:transcriptional regulator with XRE-family HTH domain